MCNVAVIEFFIENTNFGEFNDRKVLEVGSKYVNGSARPFIERFLNPEELVTINVG